MPPADAARLGERTMGDATKDEGENNRKAAVPARQDPYVHTLQPAGGSTDAGHEGVNAAGSGTGPNG